jgi:hypothetical protein
MKGASAIGFLVLAAGMICVFGQGSDPFPKSILKGRLVLDITKFAVFPIQSNWRPALNQLVTTPDGRIFVNDQNGRIYQVSADGRVVTLYLDASAILSANRDFFGESGEDGLESIAFHPDFLKAGAKGYGRFYTVHTGFSSFWNGDIEEERPSDFVNPDFPLDRRVMDDVLLEWRVADPTAATFVPADANAPYREVMRIGAPDINHTMGLAAFNPTAKEGDLDYGMLYVGVGDGGGEDDIRDLGQNPAMPFAKILRIDPLGTNGRNAQYGIPADNPFLNVDGALPETWALGFRNPQRFSWDSGGSHQMFIADIGQNSVEEIDIGHAGANYGWSVREGSLTFRSLAPWLEPATYTAPIVEYDHDEGLSVTAGFVYRAPELAALQGAFLFGDIAKGRVFSFDADHLPTGGPNGISEPHLRFDGVERTMFEEIHLHNPSAARVDLRFGTDRNGRIFLLNKQDGIVRVITGASLLPLPAPTASPAPDISPFENHPRLDQKILFIRAKRLSLHGTAVGSVVAVQYRVAPERRFHSSRNPTHWTLRIPLHRGRNRLFLRAVYVDGHTTVLQRMIVRL